MSGNGQDEQEGFLTRWSRRKSQSLRGEVPPEPVDDAEEAAPQSAEPADHRPAETEAAAAVSDAHDNAADPEAPPELPALDTLGADSDYSVFMGSNVPSDLKQKALRKLFHSPQFNVRDGLDDYDLDFSNPEPLGDVITAEMRYRVERELERLAGLDDAEVEGETTAIAAADSGEPGAPENEVDAEAEDDRPEPS
jgi:hypothetical protein